jgi:hypothetical protein
VDFATAEDIYERITAAVTGDDDADILYRDLVRLAVDYARIRTDWWVSGTERRIKMDATRTAVHNALIASCNALARYLERANRDASWRELLSDDRKTIGDFACYLHALLGVKAR